MKSLRSHASHPPQPPLHVGIIMDGNGRWAQARRLPRIAGHRQGAEAVRVAISAAVDLGVAYLTLFGFSAENWKRPRSEIADLMGLKQQAVLTRLFRARKKVRDILEGRKRPGSPGRGS